MSENTQSASFSVHYKSGHETESLFLEKMECGQLQLRVRVSGISYNHRGNSLPPRPPEHQAISKLPKRSLKKTSKLIHQSLPFILPWHSDRNPRTISHRPKFYESHEIVTHSFTATTTKTTQHTLQNNPQKSDSQIPTNTTT